MREIKFRCYIEGLHKMFYVTPSSDYTLEFGNEIPILHIHCSDGVIDSIDVENLMQFTGLQDKHGVDIYEGDILSGLWGEQRSDKLKDKLIAAVIFYDGCFVIDWHIRRHKLDSADIGIRWRESGNFGKEWFYETTPLEIIGNIYESPELLKE